MRASEDVAHGLSRSLFNSRRRLPVPSWPGRVPTSLHDRPGKRARNAAKERENRAQTSRRTTDDVGRMEFLLTLRRRGIADQAVLRAMDEVPREHFVEPGFAEAAYADQALPIACGQTISQPYVVAYMTEQLGVRPHAPRARSRHRLRLSGGGAVAAGARGGQRRALPDAGRDRARAAGRRSATTMSRSWSATASPACRRRPLRPHHRHRRRRNHPADAARPARRRRRDAAAAGSARRIATHRQAYQDRKRA